MIVETQRFLALAVKSEAGEVTQTVMVTEEVPLIESANVWTGQVINRQQLVDLPNLGRNPFMMSKIAQNVVLAGNPNFNRMQDQRASEIFRLRVGGGFQRWSSCHSLRGRGYDSDGPLSGKVAKAGARVRLGE